MNRKHILILLLAVVAVFLIMVPYTKEVKQFASADLTWAMLKKAETSQVFDVQRFGFETKTEYRPEIAALNEKKISVVGFFKREIHGSNTQLLLTETVTHVCANCNHDEHYGAIELRPRENSGFELPDDALIKVSGTFEYDTAGHLHFIINEAVTDSILILNNSKK